MTSYTITVAPGDSSGTTTTVTVETSDGDVRITDVHLHSTGGLDATRLPSVDINLLMQAISPQHGLAQASPQAVVNPTGRRAQPDAVEAPAADVADAATSAAPAEGKGTPPLGDVSAEAVSAKAPSGSTARNRSRRTVAEAAASTSPTATSSRTRRQTRSKETSPAKAASTRKTRAAQEDVSSGRQARVYRRMPDDFAAVAHELNSASAISEHYQVPRHTVQNWLRRLRAAEAG
jgi:hypothetical protein